MIVNNCFVRFLLVRVFIHQLLVLNVFAEFETQFSQLFNSIDSSLSLSTIHSPFLHNRNEPEVELLNRLLNSLDSHESLKLPHNSTLLHNYDFQSVPRTIPFGNSTNVPISTINTFLSVLKSVPTSVPTSLKLFKPHHRISKRQAPTGIIGLVVAVVSLVLVLIVIIVLFIIAMVALGILNRILRIVVRALKVLFLTFPKIAPLLPLVFKHKDIKLGILQSFHHFDNILLKKCVDIRKFPKFFKLYSKLYKVLVDKLLNKNKLKCIGPKCVTKVIGLLNAKLYSMRAEITNLERQITKLVPYKNTYTVPFTDMPSKHRKLVKYDVKQISSHSVVKHAQKPSISRKPRNSRSDEPEVDLHERFTQQLTNFFPPNIAGCMIENSKKHIFFENYYV